MPNIKIVSGTLGGRIIKTIRHSNLKPTPARIREQIFSWIRPLSENCKCLDLFAGSGSLGIEALSNGAESVVFIEQNQELYNSLYKNCKDLNILNEVRLYKQSAENYIRRTKDQSFDLIFLDPPYNKNYINKLLLRIINDFSVSGTLIYIEESNFDFSNFDGLLTLLKETTSGNSYGRLFEVTK
jgi:16S rRNA (guanine966-N2)-methyltransferase|tara:strand:- start:733 stop:1284 length:552 start_codon:yes stop_codon:yes gene_type:complete